MLLVSSLFLFFVISCGQLPSNHFVVLAGNELIVYSEVGLFITEVNRFSLPFDNSLVDRAMTLLGGNIILARRSGPGDGAVIYEFALDLPTGQIVTIRSSFVQELRL